MPQYVLSAQRDSSRAGAIGIYQALQEAQAAGSAWAGSNLSWRWAEPSPESGWPWAIGRWHAEALVVEPGFDGEEPAWFDFSIWEA